MYRNKKITVFMVSQNAEKSMERTIKAIPAFVDEIFIIDNASMDETVLKAQACSDKVKVMKNKISAGYGEACFKALPILDGDIIITIDPYGSYPVNKSETLLDYFFLNNLDFLNCARFPLKDKYSMSMYNRAGDKFLTDTANVLFGLKLKDLQSKMWIFKKDILPLLKLKSKGTEFISEIKIEVFKNKNIKSGEQHIDYVESMKKSKSFPFAEIIKTKTFLVKKRILG